MFEKLFGLFSGNNEQEDSDVSYDSLDPNEKQEVDQHGYDNWNFEEEELEEDDYYYEDDDMESSGDDDED